MLDQFIEWHMSIVRNYHNSSVGSHLLVLLISGEKNGDAVDGDAALIA